MLLRQAADCVCACLQDAYVHAWRRDATPKRGPYGSYGFNGQQHSDTYQGMSWSGNAWGNAPRPNVRGPAPPSEPYPGESATPS